MFILDYTIVGLSQQNAAKCKLIPLPYQREAVEESCMLAYRILYSECRTV